MFEQIEEALDEVAFAIKHKVALALGLTVGLGRDDRSDPAVGEGIDKWISVVCLIGNQGIWVSILDQRFCAGKIVILARREPQLDGIAQSIDERMNLGCQPAARSADRLRAVFFRAPALC